MSQQFYLEKQALVAQKLKARGVAIDIHREGESHQDPVNGTVTSLPPQTFHVFGVLLNYGLHQSGLSSVDGTLIQQGDKKVIIDALNIDSSPKLSDLLRVMGRQYQIVSCKTNAPTGIALSHELQCRLI